MSIFRRLPAALCALLLLLSGCAAQISDEQPQEPEAEIINELPAEETPREAAEDGTETFETVGLYAYEKADIMSSPSESAQSVASLEIHETLEGISLENGWWSILYNGETRYVRADPVRQIGEKNGFTVVIDAGHQANGDPGQEPIGPGAEETKAKVTNGTYGKYSGLSEAELNLAVSLKLEKELLLRGYEVIMTRRGADVNISNSERAQIANEAGADAFVRIHANGSEDSSVSGAMTVCQTAENPYNAALYARSRELSEYVLDEMCARAGCRKIHVWETDTMSGINWAQVPVTIVEMGYMSNEEEDLRLASEDYQYALAQGMANGIDRFLMN